MRMQVRSLALLSGLRIWCCYELWCRCRHSSYPKLLWPWCRPAAASSDSTPSLGASICCGCDPKKTKKKKEKESMVHIQTHQYRHISTKKIRQETANKKRVYWNSLVAQDCHCSDSGYCCGEGSIPGPRTSASHGCGHKEEE